MIRRSPLRLAGLLLLAAALPAAELTPVPRPGLENLEEVVQRQLEARRASLDELLGAAGTERAGTEPATLAAAMGEMGQLYFLYDLMEPAEACFLNARALAPDDRRWPYYLGVLCQLQGRFEESQRWLETADAEHPDDLPTLLHLGRVRLELDDLAGARKAFERAAELDPDSAAAHHGLGRVASQEGDWDGAIAELDRALELQPDATSIHHLLGMAWRQKGDLDKARHHLRLNEHGVVGFPDPLIDGLTAQVVAAQFHLKAGNEALRRGDAPRAVDEYRIAADEDPDYAPARYNLALALARTGREDEAVRELERTLAIDPDYRDAHYNLATLLAGRGDDAGAARHFEVAWRIDPQDGVARVEWAEALLRSGEPAAAAEQLAAVLKESPENQRARLALAGALEAQGDAAGAQEAYRAVTQGSGPAEGRVTAHLRLAELFESQGRVDAAIGEYQAVLEADEDSTVAHRGLASLLGRTGEFRKAAYHFSRLAEIDPRDEQAWFGRTMSLLLAGDEANARAGLEQSLVWLPSSMPLTHVLARILAASTNPAVRDGERALEMARRVFRAEPTLDHAQTVAMALAETGRFDEAVDLARQVLAEAGRRGDSSTAEAARGLLASFERREPIRAPWRP